MQKNFKQKIKSIDWFDIIFYLVSITYVITYSIIFQKIKFYWVHFYEYYVGSIFITEMLTTFNFIGVFKILSRGFADKILYIRATPLFLFLKPSPYLFFISKIILLFFLLFIFYKRLQKILSKEKTFYLTILIICSRLFLEESLNYYLNETLILIYGLFFIQLVLFFKEPRKEFLTLVFLTFLLFFSKNNALIIVPLIFLIFFISICFQKTKIKEIIENTNKKLKNIFSKQNSTELLIEKKAFFILFVLIFVTTVLKLEPNYYMSLIWIIIYILIYINLTLFFKNPKKEIFILIPIVFLLFLCMNFFIEKLQVLLFLIATINILKKRPENVLFKLFAALSFGFILYFAILEFKQLFLFNVEFVRLGITTFNPDNTLFTTGTEIFNNFRSFNFDFLLKFNSIILTILLYLSVFIYKKKKKIWFLLFLASEIYVLILNNFTSEQFYNRFFAPFYLIYFVFLIELLLKIITFISQKIKIKREIIFAIIIISLLIFNILYIIEVTSEKTGKKYKYKQYNKGIDLFTIPKNSRVFVKQYGNRCYTEFFAFVFINFLEDTEFNSNLTLKNLNSKYISLDPRFNFTAIKLLDNNFSDVRINDYILLLENETVDSNEFIFKQNYSCIDFCNFKLYQKITD